MNLKEIGFAIIFVGILVGITTTVLKVKDDAYINMIIDRNNGSCFLEDGTCLHAPQTIIPFLAGWLISLTLGVFGAYLVIVSRNRKKEDTPEIVHAKNEETITSISIPKDLNPDETLLFNKVVEAEGTIFQSDLVEKTGFTKVKVTRILDKLEGRGLIERKRRGMTNVVILNHKR